MINRMILQTENIVNDLGPLLKREPFFLYVNPSRVRKRLHISVVKLYFIPLWENDDWIVAMPGHGCETFNMKEVKPIVFHRVGLRLSDSKVLCREIVKLVLRGKANGS